MPARSIRFETFLCVMVSTAWLGTAPPVRADPLPDAATQAKAHYELGMVAYGLGHYDRAIEAFLLAHDVDPAPILLYNVAQAYWKKADNPAALTYYRRFLAADPRAAEGYRVKGRIRQLEAALEGSARQPVGLTGQPPPAPILSPAGRALAPLGAAAASAPPSTSPTVAPDLATVAMPAQTPLYRRPWFWPTVGAVSLATVAAIFMLRTDERVWSCGSECASTREIP